jgi:hypothetical protein
MLGIMDSKQIALARAFNEAARRDVSYVVLRLAARLLVPGRRRLRVATVSIYSLNTINISTFVDLSVDPERLVVN